MCRAKQFPCWPNINPYSWEIKEIWFEDVSKILHNSITQRFYNIQLHKDAVLKRGADSNLGELQRVSVDRGRAQNCQFPCKRKLIHFGFFSSFNFGKKKGNCLLSIKFYEIYSIPGRKNYILHAKQKQ